MAPERGTIVSREPVPLTPREVERVLPALLAEDLRTEIAGRWVGIKRDGEVVAAAHYRRIQGVPTLDDVWVERRHRRQGLAGQLIRAVQREKKQLWLICNTSKIRLYARHGFKREGVLPAALRRHYERLGQWPGEAPHRHAAMRWRSARVAHRPPEGP